MCYMLYHQNYLLIFILCSLNFPGHGKKQLGLNLSVKLQAVIPSKAQMPFSKENIHTHMHTCFPWIHKCVIKTVGCGTSHKYSYTYLQCKTLQTFYINIINHLYTQKIHLQSKRSVYVHIFLRLI